MGHSWRQKRLISEIDTCERRIEQLETVVADCRERSGDAQQKAELSHDLYKWMQREVQKPRWSLAKQHRGKLYEISMGELSRLLHHANSDREAAIVKRGLLVSNEKALEAARAELKQLQTRLE